MQPHICHVFYYFPSSPLSLVHGVLHFSHDWFSYHVAPLRWPRSDLKAIKHQTFCWNMEAPLLVDALRRLSGEIMIIIQRRPGVAESPAWGWGRSRTGSSQRLGGRGGSRWPSEFDALFRPVIDSFHHAGSGPMYTAAPFCLVASGDMS